MRVKTIMCSTGVAAMVALSATGCATTTTTRSTYYESAGTSGARSGTVESVGVVTQTVHGRPAAGAAAGALIGGAVFRSGWGAVGGALAGGALSSGHSESSTYEVVVRFDDGERGVFTYGGQAPFRPGDRVEMTPSGPVRVAG